MSLSFFYLNRPCCSGHASHILAYAAPTPSPTRATHRTVPQAQQHPALLQSSGKGATRILTRSPQYGQQTNNPRYCMHFPLKQQTGSTNLCDSRPAPSPLSLLLADVLNPFVHDASLGGLLPSGPRSRYRTLLFSHIMLHAPSAWLCLPRSSSTMCRVIPTVLLPRGCLSSASTCSSCTLRRRQTLSLEDSFYAFRWLC
jgi:hypothetical protein